MTDKEVLQKAIEVAIENGYEHPFITANNWSIDEDSDGLFIDCGLPVYQLIFSHDFAEAFFIDNIMAIGHISVPGSQDQRGIIMAPYWKFCLQQMVLKENPVDYLRKFIEDGDENIS